MPCKESKRNYLLLMRLVYKYRCYERTEELLSLCRVSKDLYNQALFAVRTALDDGKHLSYYELDSLMKKTPNLEGVINYRLLKAQAAQHVLKTVDGAMKGYFRSLKEWKADKSKFHGMPKIPGYRPKDGYFPVTFPNQSCTVKKGRINFSKTLSVSIPQWDRYGNRLERMQQVRVLPRNGYTEIEIVYLDDAAVNPRLDMSRMASIDLGLDNVVALVTDSLRPLLISGGSLKSRNRLFNKELARLKSVLERCNGKRTSKRLRSLFIRRDSQVDDIFHKVSKFIVRLLNDEGIGCLAYGRNKGWKDSIRLGKANNQAFVQVPFDRLRTLLKYKCEMCGIRFVETEESYTSKCDALALEGIGKHDTYLGKRTKRGLFQSSTGRLVNADVNGAINILRKVVGDSQRVAEIIGSGRLFRPLKIRNLYEMGSEILIKVR